LTPVMVIRFTAMIMAAMLMIPGQAPAGESSAPSLTLPDLEHKPRSLSEWRGKTVLLNFWASWCPTCQYEIPDLIRWQQQYGDRQFQVIGIGIDEETPLRNVARTFGVNYPVLIADPARNGRLLEEWENSGGRLPYSVIIDPDGRIVYRSTGTFTQEIFEFEILPLLSPAAQTAANNQN
jgi:thiol-disulfide isomerase/thioredoxin